MVIYLSVDNGVIKKVKPRSYSSLCLFDKVPFVVLFIRYAPRSFYEHLSYGNTIVVRRNQLICKQHIESLFDSI